MSHRIPPALRGLAAAAALAAALVAAGHGAAAAPQSPAFQPLLEEMNAREAALGSPATPEERAQARALARALVAYEKPSDALTADLRIARRIVGALAKAFAADAQMASLQDSLLDALGASVDAAAAQVAEQVATLEPGKPRARAEARLAAVDAALDAAAVASPRTKRVAALQRADRAVAQAEKAARKGNPGVPSGNAVMTATIGGAAWTANPSLGAGVTGGVAVSLATGGVREILLRGRMYRYTPSPVPGADPTFDGIRTVEIRVTSLGADIATGTHSIGLGALPAVSVTYTDEDAEGVGPIWYAISGSVTFTTLNGTPGAAGASGTFGCTLWDPATDATLGLVGGAFNVSGLPRTVLP